MSLIDADADWLNWLVVGFMEKSDNGSGGGGPSGGGGCNEALPPTTCKPGGETCEAMPPKSRG